MLERRVPSPCKGEDKMGVCEWCGIYDHPHPPPSPLQEEGVLYV